MSLRYYVVKDMYSSDISALVTRWISQPCLAPCQCASRSFGMRQQRMQALLIQTFVKMGEPIDLYTNALPPFSTH
jgi:hypothetical protein